MRIFDQPIYITPSNPKGDVIIFGKAPELVQSDHEIGVARIGGPMRTPSYLMAYIRAAGILIHEGHESNTLDDICLPAFYMQRHSVELLLKRFLFWVYEYAKNCRHLRQPSNGQLLRLRKRHNLSQLLDDLVKSCKLYEFQAPPKKLRKIVNKIESYELTETWSRYDSSGVEGKDGIIKHLENETVIPIVELQSQIETLVSEITYKFDGTDSFESEIYFAWDGSENHNN